MHEEQLSKILRARELKDVSALHFPCLLLRLPSSKPKAWLVEYQAVQMNSPLRRVRRTSLS
jgi:hypothetical protein